MRVAEQIDRDVLGSFAVFRNQDASARLVPLGADILVGDEREAVLLEAISVPLRVIDELLRQENVAWLGEGLDARSDDDDVGNFGVLRAFQSGIEFPEPAVRAHSSADCIRRPKVGRSVRAPPARACPDFDQPKPDGRRRT
jgi:hypothetical protein